LPDNPYILTDHPFFDRPELALANLAQLEFGDTYRSLADPGRLTPEKRKKLAERFGLEGPLASLVNITTHPLVLLGLGLVLTHKLPAAFQGLPYTKASQEVIKRFRPLEWFQPLSEVFHGTPVWNMLTHVVRRTQSFYNRYADRLIDGMETYQNTTGRKLAADRGVVLAAYLDRLHDSNNPVWRKLIGRAVDHADDYGLSASELTAAKAALANPTPGVVVDSALTELHGVNRAVFNDIYKALFSDPANEAEVLKVLATMKGLSRKVVTKGGKVKNVSKVNPEAGVEFREGYWPHVRVLNPEQRADPVFSYLNEITPENVKRVTQTSQARRMRNRMLKQADKSAVERLDQMLPDPDDLVKLGTPEPLVNLVRKVGQAEGVPFYSLKYDKVMDAYLDGTARTYSWTLPPSKDIPTGFSRAVGLGQQLTRQATKLAAGDATSRAKAAMLLDVYQPLALGGMTAKQGSKAMWWASGRQLLQGRLESGPVGKALGKVAPKLKSDLMKFLGSDPLATYPGAGQAISGFFYNTTIGGNPLSAGLNLLQPLVTLTGRVETPYVLEGYKTALGGLKKYWGLRRSGIKPDRALIQAFPKFGQAHQELVPLHRSEFAELVEDSFSRAFRASGGFGKAVDKTRSGLMFMFSQSELLNRLVSFHAAYAKALKEFPGHKFYSTLRGRFARVPKRVRSAQGTQLLHEAASDYASYVTTETQFGSGFLNKPSGLLETWSPFTQFMSFPLHLLGMATGPAMRDKAVLGRMMLASGLAYGAAKEGFGADIGRGLLFGGLPEPSEYGPFAPLPLVPPAVQMIGSGLQAAARGSAEPLRESLPLMIPGGVAAARAVGMGGAAPGIAGTAAAGASKLIGRPYADYENRLPDGRIAVYTSEGSLVGYFTPGQIYARALGFAGPAKQAEQAVTKYLLAQRTNLREMKRTTMQALSENDPGHVLELSQDYQKMFPRAGGLPIKKSDVRSLHLRQDISRVERLLETMPKELRAEYLQIIAAALGPNYPEIFGLLGGQPLGKQPIMYREPYRAHRLTDTSARVSKGLHGVKLREKLRARGHQATRATHERRRLGYSGFGTYEGF
jgi:hypothetical protein